jgi:large subunit ribosomal protein L29
MKAADIRRMTTSEIESNLVEYENTLVTLRYNHFIQPVENPSRMRRIRQDIARMYTILRERELQG